MTIEQQLHNLFGTSFDKRTSIVEVRAFHSDTAYCLDDDGNLIALAARHTDTAAVEIPAAFGALQYLNLSDNEQLTSLRFEKPLPQLKHLDVSDSQLKEFKLLQGFGRIQWLDLSRNQLKSFTPVGAYPSLAHLDLSGNPLEQFQADWLLKFPNLERLYLRGNKVASPQKRVFTEEPGSCLPDMKRFLKSLQESGAKKDNEQKVLVVGDGGVGKSCLVERLIYKTFEKNHHSTHGVALHVYREEDYPYLLNFWDFGGQDIYHATHRMFMQENAIYLALWDEFSQKEPESRPIIENNKEKTYPNRKLRYWLYYIKVFGGQSPVVVVKTKAAGKPEDHPERSQFIKQYGNYFTPLKFLKLDSKEPEEAADDFDTLRDAVKRIIKKKNKDAELPGSWAKVRTWVREQLDQKNKLIPFSDFKEKVTQEEAAADLDLILKWLNNTGVFFYRKGHFNDQIVVDQNWMITAVYAIFDREFNFYYLSGVQKEHNYFKGENLKRLWSRENEQYSEADMLLFLDFMLTCEIIFEDQYKDKGQPDFSERRFVAPQLLNDRAPNEVENLREDKELLHVRYRHPILQYGIIQSFIIQTSHLARLDHIWKQGTIIYDRASKTRAIVLADGNDIKVEIPQEGIKTLSKIRTLLSKIQENLEVTESYSLDGQFYVDKQKLENWTAPIIEVSDGKISQPIETIKLKPFLFEDKQAQFEEKEKPASKRSRQVVRQKIREAETFIAEAEYREALETLIPLIPEEEDSFQSFKQQLAGVQRDVGKGLVDYKVKIQLENRIAESLRTIIHEAKKRLFP